MDKTKNAIDLAKEYKITRAAIYKIIENKKKRGSFLKK